jgi:hypothetical protein
VQDGGITQLADDVVVISLPERKDRRAQIKEMMKMENLWFRFVDGVKVSNQDIHQEEISEVGREHFKMTGGFDKYLRGMVGCRRAHLRELASAKERGLSSLLIIEDDMRLVPGWFKYFSAALEELPSGWLQLHFSCSDFMPSEQISKHLRRVRGAYQTTAILYSGEGIVAAHNCLSHSRSEIDHWMGKHLHPFGNSYALEPRIAYQKGGVSDIMGVDRGITA